MTPISVLIADDHPIFREGLQRILESEDGIRVVHAAENGTDALQQAVGHAPQVLILDVSMPEMGGLEVAEEKRRKRLPFEVVLLTMHDDRETFARAMDLGVKGYVLKDDASDDIVRCVKAVQSGKTYVSAGVTHHLLESRQPSSRGRAGGSQAAEVGQLLQSLTTAERRILRLIAKDMSSKEVASELGISPKTVDNHRSNICHKLGLFGSHSLMRFALENRDHL